VANKIIVIKIYKGADAAEKISPGISSTSFGFTV
jgi:hypothetical protein